MTAPGARELMGPIHWELFERVASADPNSVGIYVSRACSRALTVLAKHGFDASEWADRLPSIGTDTFLVTVALASAEFNRQHPNLPVEAELASDLLFALCRLAYADAAPDAKDRVCSLVTAALSVGQAEMHLMMATPGGLYSYVDREETRHIKASAFGSEGAKLKQHEADAFYRPMLRDFLVARANNPQMSLRAWTERHAKNYTDREGRARSAERARKALGTLLQHADANKIGHKPGSAPPK